MTSKSEQFRENLEIIIRNNLCEPLKFFLENIKIDFDFDFCEIYLESISYMNGYHNCENNFMMLSYLFDMGCLSQDHFIKIFIKIVKHKQFKSCEKHINFLIKKGFECDNKHDIIKILSYVNSRFDLEVIKFILTRKDIFTFDTQLLAHENIYSTPHSSIMYENDYQSSVVIIRNYFEFIFSYVLNDLTLLEDMINLHIANNYLDCDCKLITETLIDVILKLNVTLRLHRYALYSLIRKRVGIQYLDSLLQKLYVIGGINLTVNSGDDLDPYIDLMHKYNISLELKYL